MQTRFVSAKDIDIHLKRMIGENKELKLECKENLSLLKILIYIYILKE